MVRAATRCGCRDRRRTSRPAGCLHAANCSPACNASVMNSLVHTRVTSPPGGGAKIHRPAWCREVDDAPGGLAVNVGAGSPVLRPLVTAAGVSRTGPLWLVSDDPQAPPPACRESADPRTPGAISHYQSRRWAPPDPSGGPSAPGLAGWRSPPAHAAAAPAPDRRGVTVTHVFGETAHPRPAEAVWSARA